MSSQVTNLGTETVVSAEPDTRVAHAGVEAVVRGPTRSRVPRLVFEVLVAPPLPEVEALDCPPVGLGLPHTGTLLDGDSHATDGLLVEVPLCLELEISGLDTALVPDDGGIVVNATGVFPPELAPFAIEIVTADGLIRRAYSGVLGQGSEITSPDMLTLAFVAPPMPVGGPYAVRVLSLADPAAVATLTEGLAYIRRSFETNLYSMRLATPPPRAVGALSVEDES